MLYSLWISMIPGIGPVNARKLIAFCGSAEAVYREKNQHLTHIPGIGQKFAELLRNSKSLQTAEKELSFCERYKIRIYSFQDDDFPFRLKQCADSPVVMYYKGNADLNPMRVIAVVGTRKATAYGKEACRNLIENLAGSNVLIVSGLAYGIDTCSHRAALDNGLMTVGVLGHGLDRLYPASNKSLAEKMLSQGGLLTDFPSGTKPDRENFPCRNRIIAGLCDAIVVVEGAREGGALITADIANSYSRDVFSIPGRWGDPFSEGCNYLISNNKAALIQSPADFMWQMGWEAATQNEGQQTLFRDLTADEELLLRIILENKEIGIDALCLASGFTLNRLSACLLNMELNQILSILPGKRYCIGRQPKK
ncbi:MAG: DNA-processing protein DprA [Bacteroidota bacterium]